HGSEADLGKPRDDDFPATGSLCERPGDIERLSPCGQDRRSHCRPIGIQTLNTTRDWNLLTINAGSSSLKVALYQMGSLETCLLTANVERIGSPVSRITIAYKNNGPAFDHQEKLTDHSVALAAVLSRIENRWSAANLDGIGHRIVLGDSRCREPLRIDDELLFRFQELADRAPDHLPQVVDSIAAVARIYPDVPQVACFDS